MTGKIGKMVPVLMVDALGKGEPVRIFMSLSEK